MSRVDGGWNWEPTRGSGIVSIISRQWDSLSLPKKERWNRSRILSSKRVIRLLLHEFIVGSLESGELIFQLMDLIKSEIFLSMYFYVLIAYSKTSPEYFGILQRTIHHMMRDTGYITTQFLKSKEMKTKLKHLIST